MTILEKEIGNVSQQNLAGCAPELTVYHVSSDIAGGKSFCHTPVWIRLADRTLETELMHKATDLLHIHDNAHVEKPHVDALGPLVVATEPVGFQYEFKVLFIRVMTGFANRSL